MKLLLTKILKRLLATKNPDVWPKLDDEIGDWKKYLKGRCLNAGAGHRDIAHIIEGELINQDISTGMHNKNIHIYSPLHEIPVTDGHFDSIICNAVLELVENPDEVLSEFYRVLKEDGYLYLCIPFLQPYHPDPTDYQRYTKEGLYNLMEKHGFQTIEFETLHTVYHTLAWIVRVWLRSEDSFLYSILRIILFPILRNRCLYSSKKCEAIATAYRLIAVKNRK
jgi:SAM-dependent methyltransferase